MNNHFFNGLLRRRDSAFSTDLLITAIGYLDFFNWLKNNPTDFQGICRDLKLAERPADVMLTFFSALNLLEKKGTKYYVSKNCRTFLSDNSKSDLSGYFNSLQERPICKDILSVLKHDEPLHWAYSTKRDEWAKAMGKKDFARSFTAAMDSRGAIIAPALARKINCINYTRLLDIAGASGVYSCALVRRYPHLHAAVLEKPPVDKIAVTEIKKQGLSKKISVIPADMFSNEWPGGFDVHLLSHVLHDWDTKSVRLLLQKSFDALKPNGLLAVHDAHINFKKTGPIEAAEYSVLLMLSTRGKCYSIEEIKKMLRGVGFTKICLEPTAGFRSVITARKPG